MTTATKTKLPQYRKSQIWEQSMAFQDGEWYSDGTLVIHRCSVKADLDKGAIFNAGFIQLEGQNYPVNPMGGELVELINKAIKAATKGPSYTVGPIAYCEYVAVTTNSFYEFKRTGKSEIKTAYRYLRLSDDKTVVNHDKWFFLKKHLKFDRAIVFDSRQMLLLYKNDALVGTLMPCDLTKTHEWDWQSIGGR